VLWTPVLHLARHRLARVFQDFFFCKSLVLREKRDCNSVWNMRSGVEAFMATMDAKKLPVTET
jgi:hypothetical protein